MSFADHTDDMDEMIMSSLNDGTAEYSCPAGAVSIHDIEVIIDHNLQRVGPEGLFRSDAVGITWKKRDLPSAARGGFFRQGCKRYCIEDVIEDDGHMATAVCMEVR